jgi:hypothetical protein
LLLLEWWEKMMKLSAARTFAGLATTKTSLLNMHCTVVPIR